MFMSRAAMTEREVIRDLHHVTGGGLKEKIIEQHKRNCLDIIMLCIVYRSYQYSLLQ